MSDDLGLFEWLSNVVSVTFIPRCPQCFICHIESIWILLHIRCTCNSRGNGRTYPTDWLYKRDSMYHFIFLGWINDRLNSSIQMVDSGNSLQTYPKEIQLTRLSPLVLILTTHISFVYPIAKKEWEVTGFSDYDLFFQTDPCGLQLFHLLSHTNGSGGTTLLVDGFYVASILKELHPESYDLLSRIPVRAHSAGESTALYTPSPPSGYPVLGHDPLTGELTQVRWNNDDRSVMNHLQPDLVEKWCFIWVYTLSVLIIT